MDQFNRDTYKKETLFQEFYHSCLGKIIILAVILLILFVVGVMTVPSDKMVVRETMDNIHQCLQDNDSINNDELDEDFANISRTFSEADTTLTNPEILQGLQHHCGVRSHGLQDRLSAQYTPSAGRPRGYCHLRKGDFHRLLR